MARSLIRLRGWPTTPRRLMIVFVGIPTAAIVFGVTAVLIAVTGRLSRDDCRRAFRQQVAYWREMWGR